MPSISTYTSKLRENKRVIVPNGTYTAASGAWNATSSGAGATAGFAILQAESYLGVTIDATHNAFKLKGAKNLALIGIKTIGVMEFSGANNVWCWFGDHSYPLGVFNSVLDHSPDGVHLTDSTDCKHYGCNVHDAADFFDLSGATRPWLQGIHTWAQISSNSPAWHSDSHDGVNGGIVDFVCRDSFIENCRFQLEARSKGNINFCLLNNWMANSPGLNVETPTDGVHTTTGERKDCRVWNYKNVNEHDYHGQAVVDTNLTIGAPAVGAIDPATTWRTTNPYSSYLAFFGWSDPDAFTPDTGNITLPPPLEFVGKFTDVTTLQSLTLADNANVDDLLFAFVASSNDQAITAVDVGWTDLGEVTSVANLRGHLWSRKVVSAGSSWTFTVPTGNLTGGLMWLHGQHATLPIDVTATNQITSTATAQVASAVNIPNIGDMLITFFANDNVASGVDYTAPPDMVVRATQKPTGSNSCPTIAIFTRDDESAGDTGTRTATSSAADQYVSFTVAVRPAPRSTPGGKLPRRRFNNKNGSLKAVALQSATTLQSAAFAAFPVITAPDYTVLVLDQDRVAGEPELVFVTDHALSSETVTVTRAQYGTVARQHAIGIKWAHVATAEDYESELVDGITMSSTNGRISVKGQGVDTAQLRDGSVDYTKFATTLTRRFRDVATALPVYALVAREGDEIRATDTNIDYEWDGAAWVQIRPVPAAQANGDLFSAFISTQTLIDDNVDVQVTTSGATIASGTITKPAGWNTFLVALQGHWRLTFLPDDATSTPSVRATTQIETGAGNTLLGRSFGHSFEDVGAGAVNRYDETSMAETIPTLSADTAWRLRGTMDVGDSGTIHCINHRITAVKYRLS